MIQSFGLKKMCLRFFRKKNNKIYDILDVCRYIINYSNEQKYLITNLRLQKLLYFIQAYFIASADSTKVCFESRIEAWDFGPVVPEAYKEYERFANSQIPKIESYIVYDKKDLLGGIHREYYSDIMFDKDDKARIQYVVDMFSQCHNATLVEISQKQDPWINAYNVHKYSEITVESMRKYFINFSE